MLSLEIAVLILSLILITNAAIADRLFKSQWKMHDRTSIDIQFGHEESGYLSEV
jgi:hypothetical protein